MDLHMRIGVVYYVVTGRIARTEAHASRDVHADATRSRSRSRCSRSPSSQSSST